MNECKHCNKTSRTVNETRSLIVYLICTDCGKILGMEVYTKEDPEKKEYHDRH